MSNSMTIKEFCSIHKACDPGREWALANCSSMQEAWDTCSPEYLLWIATRPDVLSEQALRLLALSFARSVQHLMTDPRSLQALDIAEQYVHGLATTKQLDAAWATATEALKNTRANASIDAKTSEWKIIPSNIHPNQDYVWVLTAPVARTIAEVKAKLAAAQVAADITAYCSSNALVWVMEGVDEALAYTAEAQAIKDVYDDQTKALVQAASAAAKVETANNFAQLIRQHTPNFACQNS